MNVQGGSVLRYLNFLICQSLLGFSVDQTYHIMEIVNECTPTGKFRKVDTTFRTEYKYKKGLMDETSLTEMPFIRHQYNTMENLDILLERHNTLLL